MFFLATGLVGVIGIVLVRRRFARKRQQVSGPAA